METKNYLDVLEGVIGVVAEDAGRVDKLGAFPEKGIGALAKAGLLGAMSDRAVGGLGLGLRGASGIIERLARECGSTAMVTTMHFAGTAVLEKTASEAVRRAAAKGEHLSTLAFSEAGSRAQFWVPIGTAKAEGDKVRLDAQKSMVTSAARATAYVWSSRPLAAEGLSTLWLVPRDAKGISISGAFDGLGLRGNDSAPVAAKDAEVSRAAMLGEDGKGFDLMMGVVLPLFNILNASCSVGLMEGAFTRLVRHVSETRHEHAGTALRDLPTIRAYMARIRVRIDQAKALLASTLDALDENRPDAMLRVLETKASADDTGVEVHDLVMRVAGGAAFRKDVAVERFFRDARAAGIMAPTTDILYDFIGKAACGLPLF